MDVGDRKFLANLRLWIRGDYDPDVLNVSEICQFLDWVNDLPFNPELSTGSALRDRMVRQFAAALLDTVQREGYWELFRRLGGCVNAVRSTKIVIPRGTPPVVAYWIRGICDLDVRHKMKLHIQNNPTRAKTLEQFLGDITYAMDSPAQTTDPLVEDVMAAVPDYARWHREREAAWLVYIHTARNWFDHQKISLE